jgi:DNA-directed RNA polymerase omega subunit
MSIMLYNNALQRKLMRQANEVRKPLDLSRGPSIDMEKCVAAVGGNRFNLVLIASARTREIRRQHAHSDKREHVHPIVTALADIEAGGIESGKYLAKVK